MESVIYPIQHNEIGSHVINLIECIELLIDHSVIKVFDSPNQPTADDVAELVIRMKEELAQQRFGEASQRLVFFFQLQNNLGDQLRGAVDKKTADALNQVIAQLGISTDAQSYEVFGIVMDAKGRRLAGIEVRAFDRDWQRETILGHAITDPAGAYCIIFPASFYRKTPAEIGGPDLVVRAFDEQGFLLKQSGTLVNADIRTELNLTLENDLRWVSGTVVDDNGRARENLVVRAYDQDLRREELLGEALTDAKGQYQIHYTPAQFKRAEKLSADLRVRVFVNSEKEVAVSTTLFNAPERAVIDLNVTATFLQKNSEWETYLTQLNPLLEKLPLHELTDEDNDFLAKETGIAIEHLEFIRLDAQWRHEHQKQKIPASAFYGLLRQGLSKNWANLINAEPERWRSALKQAIADHQVPETLSQALDAFVATLTKVAVDYSFVEPAADSKQLPFVGALLTSTKLNAKQQRVIAEAMLGRSLHESSEQLITHLAQAKVPAAAINTARFAIEAFGLVNQHLPTLVALQTSVATDFGAGTDLAKLSRAQWLDVSKNLVKVKNLPPEFTSKEDYAEYLADRVEYTFPTAVVAYQLIEIKEPARRDVGLLLIQNPEFDLLTTQVDSFFKSAKLGKIKTKPEILKQQLDKEVRVARLVPTTNRAVHMTNLIEQGFDSTVKISLTSKQVFTAKMQKTSSKSAAQKIYSTAKSRAKDITLQTIRTLDHFDPIIRFMPPLKATPDSDLADWLQLFGSTNGCYCPPCDSVHGPAAYLMDLFEFLKDKDAIAPAGGENLLTVLFHRRPDLQHLKLNCANAETPVPYIDLVIELLEQHIIGDATAASTPQTPEQLENVKNVAACLRAQPHIDDTFDGARRRALYISGELTTANYPWNLPFDRDFLKAGIYFSLLGTSPAEVLSLKTESTESTEIKLYRSRLNLSSTNWRLLHNPEGVEPSAAAVTASWGMTEPLIPLSALTNVGKENGLLARSGLSVTELFALIESPLMAGWRLKITWPEDADHCDIEQAQLKESLVAGSTSTMSAQTQVKLFDFIQRLLSLRIALGWPLERLTQALTALNISNINTAFDLVALSRLVFLATQLSVSVETLSLALISLTHATSDTAEPTETIKAAEAAFARATWLSLLRVSEVDHNYLTELGMLDTLAQNSPVDRLTSLEQVLETLAQLRAAKIDPAECRYLLQHKDLVPNVFTTSDEKLEQQFSTLMFAIQSTRIDEPVFSDLASLPEDATDSEREQLRLEEVARADAIAAVQRELASRKLVAAIESLRAITGYAFIKQVVSDNNVDGSRTEALLSADEFFTGHSSDGIVQKFIVIAAMSSSDANYAEHLTIAKKSLVKVVKTARLLALLNFTSADLNALAKLRRDNVIWFDFNTLPGAEDDTLGLSSIDGLLKISIAQQTMPKADFRLLQIIADETSVDSKVIKLESITGWGKSLTQTLGSDTGTTEPVLLQLANTLGLTDWSSPSTYSKLQIAVAWLQGRRLSISPNNHLQVLLDAVQSPTENIVRLESLARSRFATEAEWFVALTPAMDRLRARQRDALLSYVLNYNARGLEPWKTVDDIYAYLLIDVQMGPCQLSSRIVQAHSAIQLFVQRCLMHLEKPEEIALGNVSNIQDWKQWEWMKNYRVWEAGRKIFLYPENWIEPDLRDNKSPFFEELENELLQSEITTESVERATRNYLTKLHEVARLDIRALYEETVTETHGDGTTTNSTIIHMVGRTHAIPHIYFYRKRLADSTWTSWEKIELSIDADHLVLVVHNRQPMLFWPQFKEIQIDKSDPATTALDLSLKVSRLEFGKWAAPTGSQDAIRIAKDQLLTLSLRPRVNREECAIEILVYEYLHLSVQNQGVEFSRSKFILDCCTDSLSINRINPILIRFLPPFVEPGQQLLIEQPDGNGSGTYIRFTADTNDEHAFIISELPVAEQRAIVGEILAELFLTILTLGAHRPSDRWIRHVADDRYDPVSLLFNAEVDGFKLLPCQQNAQFNYRQPYVLRYIDRQIFAIKMEKAHAPATGFQYLLESADHPFVCDLLEALRADGLSGIYRPDEVQRRISAFVPTWVIRPLKEKRHPRQLTETDIDWVETHLRPNNNLIAKPHPISQFDFNEFAAFGLYNWEIFFHIPLLIADRLNKNGRYKEAQEWFHCIFDPADVSPHPAPQKYWRVKPFFLQQQAWAPGAIESLQAMMRRLSEGADDLERQVDVWRNDPFNPHLLARIRLVSYMKTVVQKYIENLTAWGDSLFRRDTMESINEATQLYVLANEILGPAQKIAPPKSRMAKSYDELSSRDSIDAFSNVIVGLETGIPFNRTAATSSGRPAPELSILYFCIPSNSRLLEIRTIISDRLFKIRHCMNIDGKSRQLALFAPPIDPALLVRARAAGLDIGAMLDMAMGSRMKHYRFQPLLQKAFEFCSEVRSFGGALLSALEKQDSELLGQVRARHEVGMLKLGALVKRQQLEEAEANLDAVRKSRLLVEARLEYYGSREFMNAAEGSQIVNLSTAHVFQTVAESVNLAAAVAYGFPDATVGPTGGVTYGGTYIGNTLKTAGGALSIVASQFSFAANMSAIVGGYQRRDDDWKHQADLARKELNQIDQQIIAAEIRFTMAEQDQRNHAQQIEQSQEIEAMLRERFTNTQLYSWMSAQLSAMHYQAYQMAFDLAKQAEAAAQREVIIANNFIQFDNWDGGHKGLLAGERLAQDLRRLDIAYMQANTRLLEISSNISIRRLDPAALWNLRAGKLCKFSLPTWLFDMDFPGHQRRRIKSVSVSIPGVVGPYGGVSGILTCTPIGETSRSIATSSGQNDAGVFQLDFRDERYLPFEGISLDDETSWSFSLPAVLHSFDYETISDLILHIQYTAQEGTDEQADSKRFDIETLLSNASDSPLKLLVSTRHDFPIESRQLQEGIATEITVELSDHLFPYFARRRNITSIERLQEGGATITVWPSTPTSGSTAHIPLTEANSYFIVSYYLDTNLTT